MQLSRGGRRLLPVERYLRLIWLALALLCMPAHAADLAQAVGEVTALQGAATAQRSGEAPRFLEKGSPVHEGEIISTGGQGYAILGFKDETKITLRPNTSFTVERLRQGGADESAAFRLIKGGVRAVTGLIGKRSPRNVEFKAATATIGIRGTSFDARLCENDCAEERGRPAAKGPAATPDPFVARVAVLAGSAQAIATNAQTRALSEGSALYNGESVRTDKASHVVLAFRDQSKVTVIADSEFKLENVRFTGQQSDSGNFAVRIVRGGVRALTGLLAKRDPQSVQFRATTAVIGLRGTGLDAQVQGDNVFLFQWENVSYLIEGGREVRVDPGAAAIFSAVRNLLALLDKPPEFFLTETAPRPDRVEVNFDSFFSGAAVDNVRGLTVGVQDGEIVLSGPGGFIYLTRNESGYLPDGQNVPVRVVPYWQHLLRDPVLNLSQADEGRSGRSLEVIGPGGLICR